MLRACDVDLGGCLLHLLWLAGCVQRSQGLPPCRARFRMLCSRFAASPACTPPLPCSPGSCTPVSADAPLPLEGSKAAALAAVHRPAIPAPAGVVGGCSGCGSSCRSSGPAAGAAVGSRPTAAACAVAAGPLPGATFWPTRPLPRLACSPCAPGSTAAAPPSAGPCAGCCCLSGRTVLRAC